MPALPSSVIDRLYKLNVGVVGTGTERHERPHKPLLLLTVLSLLDEGAASPSAVAWDVRLRDKFSLLFKAVRKANDRDTPENPFRYLASDGFWELRRSEGGCELPFEGKLLVKDSGHVWGRFIGEFSELTGDPSARREMRESIVARYFPHAADKLLGGFAECAPMKDSDESADETSGELAGRSSAFRSAVVRAYDFQCAACGLRIRIGDTVVSFVDAAHLVPFSFSRNDHPTNGMALCKNHHWALDRGLIAPAPEGHWRVSRRILAHRSTGEQDLRALEERTILVPSDEAYSPDKVAMKWRVDRLIA